MGLSGPVMVLGRKLYQMAHRRAVQQQQSNNRVTTVRKVDEQPIAKSTYESALILYFLIYSKCFAQNLHFS